MYAPVGIECPCWRWCDVKFAGVGYGGEEGRVRAAQSGTVEAARASVRRGSRTRSEGWSARVGTGDFVRASERERDSAVAARGRGAVSLFIALVNVARAVSARCYARCATRRYGGTGSARDRVAAVGQEIRPRLFLYFYLSVYSTCLFLVTSSSVRHSNRVRVRARRVASRSLSTHMSAAV